MDVEDSRGIPEDPKPVKTPGPEETSVETETAKRARRNNFVGRPRTSPVCRADRETHNEVGNLSTKRVYSIFSVVVSGERARLREAQFVVLIG